MKRLTQHVKALSEGMVLLDEIRSIGATVRSKSATPATEQPAMPDLDAEDGDAAKVGGASGADGLSDEPNLNLAASF